MPGRYEMQFLCIAKRVTVNNVNSNRSFPIHLSIFIEKFQGVIVHVHSRDDVSKQAYISRKRDNASMN